MPDFPLGEALVPIRMTLDKFKEDSKKVTNKLGGFVKNVGKGAVIGTAGAIAAVGAGAVAAGVEVTQFAESFQDATNALVVGTGATGQSLSDMENVVKRLKGSTAGLGQDFGTLGSVVAEVNTRTGATGKQLQDFSSDVLDLTRLTGGDAVKNTQLISRVMGDWGVEMGDSAALMDTLFGAGQAFGIGIEDISGKVVQFGAPLREMGFSLDESIALFGKWEKEGVNTELAIGSLRIAAGKFAKGGGEFNDQVDEMATKLEEVSGDDWSSVQGSFEDYINLVMTDGDALNDFLMDIPESMRSSVQELGQSIADAGGGQVDLQGQLQATMDAIKNATSDTDALAIAMDTFGARAGPDMAAAIREGRFELDEAIQSLQGTEGGLQDAADRALTFAERMETMKSQTMVALLPVGQAFMDLAEDAMPVFQEFLLRAIPIVQDFAATFKNNLGPAVMLINDALTRIATAVGASSEEVTLMDVAVNVLTITLDLIVTAMQAVALIAQGVAWAIEGITAAVKTGISWAQSYADALGAIGIDIPDWMVPGSPTPLERGIRGINDALRSLPSIDNALSFNMAGKLAVGGQQTGGKNYTINVGNVTATGEGGLDEAFTQLLDMMKGMLDSD